MEIIQRTVLSEKEKKQITKFMQTVKNFDHTYREPYLSNQFNYFNEMPTFILAYQQEMLIGFMMLYADGEPSESVDIFLYVLPSKRRLGIGSELINAGKEILSKFGYQQFDFVTEQSFLDKNPNFLINTGLSIDKAENEYQMYKKDAEKFKLDQNLKIRLLKESDLDSVVPMYCESFGDVSTKEAYNYLSEGIKDNNTENYLLTKDNEPAGLCAVDISDTSYYLFGLLIATKFQGKGFGTNFVKALMYILSIKKPLPFSLGVEQTNAAACNLYKKVGFIEQTKILYLKPKI